jgi:hypothetical protein
MRLDIPAYPQNHQALTYTSVELARQVQKQFKKQEKGAISKPFCALLLRHRHGFVERPTLMRLIPYPYVHVTSSAGNLLCYNLQLFLDLLTESDKLRGITNGR